MFDRYSDHARSLVAVAGEEARQLGHGHVGTEHLLLGFLSHRPNVVTRALPTGTTLHVVRRKVEEAVGDNGSAPDGDDQVEDLPFTPRAKRALGRASRFSLQRHEAQVQVNHVVLGVLDVEGTAGQVLRGLGVDVGRLREASDRASDEPLPAPPATNVAPLVRPSPRCSGCGATLDATLSSQILSARSEDGEERRFVVAYCSACGSSIGATPANSG